MTSTDQLTHFPPPRTSPYLPPAEYARLLDEPEVCQVTMRDGTQVWAVTRHEQVRAAFTHPRLSSDRSNPRFPGAPPIRPGEELRSPHLIGMDPPQHGPARRAVTGEFTLRRLEALRPRIQQMVDEHIDAMLELPRPADLMQALALPVPSLVICELLGVPYDDHAFFQRHSTTMLQVHSTTREDRGAAADELRTYVGKLIMAKQQSPSDDDLLGRQIQRQLAEDGSVDYETLVGLAFILLIAGHETTANMISLGTLALLEHPDWLAAIRADPGRTLGAVEEMLRIFTITDTVTVRVATEDVELGGTTIPEGDGVLIVGNAANHDPRAFPDPDRFDVDRGARNHVAFGYGIHQCLGQNLARIELQIIFDTLFARVPDLRLARPVQDLPFKDDGMIYGLYELPVSW